MAIYYNEQLKTFYLESENLSYVFCVNDYGFLNHLYYGKRIPREDLSHSIFYIDRGHGCCLPGKSRAHSLSVYANECPTFGRTDYRESMIALCDYKGCRVGDLKYIGHEIVKEKPAISGMPSVRGGETLIVDLKDDVNGALAKLYYTVFEDLPVILRHVKIENTSNQTLTIDRAYSFSVDFPDKAWEAIALPGAHLRERFIERTPLSHGVFAVDSKRGVSSGQMNPFFAIVRNNTDENQGEVYGFNFVYSGDFTFKAQIDQNEDLRVLGGINDYDFEWELKSGESFETPEMVLVYSDAGLGKMSRAFHDLYRNYLVNPRFVKKPRPIVINNWEATYFNFDTEKLCAIIDSVEGTGIDTFVLDDGWFGVRNHDRSGLGDWFVNLNKLPQGHTPIIEHAQKKGMKFGLWFEPEMVNKDSDLYRKHPDWIIQAEGIEPCPGRDQYVLDLTRDEVCQYIIDSVSAILKNNDIDYVKWDMNRTLTDNYSVKLGKRSKETHHRYVLGLYKICEAIVNGFPNVFFEGCASGGCRFDAGILYYFPQIWTSDDSDAYLRTIIQYGTSLCYPLSAMSCHVSACPNHQCGRVTPFDSRADIAHLGATGYELDTTKTAKEDLDKVKKQVEQYKKMESLVLHGDLYRLNNPLEENLFAEMIVSKDKSFAHATVMRPLSIPNGECIRIYPKGLNEAAFYYVPELDLTKSGAVWMQLGMIVHTAICDFATKTYTFIEQKQEAIL